MKLSAVNIHYDGYVVMNRQYVVIFIIYKITNHVHMVSWYMFSIKFDDTSSKLTSIWILHWITKK